MVEVGGSNPPGPTKHETLALAGLLFLTQHSLGRSRHTHLHMSAATNVAK
jgi:hypothetical protein